MAMINRAGALNLVGPANEAVKAGQEALRQVEHLRDEGWLSYAEYILGVGTSMAGDYRRAAQLLSSARHRIIYGGVQPPLSSHVMHLPLMCTFVLVNCGFALGDAEAVEAHHRFIADTAERTKLPLAHFATAFSRGILLLLRDELRDAEWHLDHALQLLRQNDLMLFTPLASFCLGAAIRPPHPRRSRRPHGQLCRDSSTSHCLRHAARSQSAAAFAAAMRRSSAPTA
jgi:hypothetical protein